MTLSILIVNWNSKAYLAKCLESIRRTCDDLAPQIVVVDGGSFDGSAEMIALGYPEVEFVQSEENIGFGRSNNLGFEKVKGDVVLLLNPDTELHEGAVQHLLQALESEENTGIIGARMLNTDGSLQLSSILPLPRPWNCALDSEFLRNRWWRNCGPSEGGAATRVEAVSGACMVMRSEVFRKVGGFSPQYFMYAEDMDLCLKVARAGLNIYHEPKAWVVHHGGGSSSTQVGKFSILMIRQALYVYMRSNHGLVTAVRYRSLMGVSAMLRIGLLAAYSMLTGRGKKLEQRVSIAKWWIVLRWVLGRENWVQEHFRIQKKSVSSASDRYLEASPKSLCTSKDEQLRI
jgi:GT2 family glycosyltransferase